MTTYTEQKYINQVPLKKVEQTSLNKTLHRTIVAVKISQLKSAYLYDAGTGILISNNLILTSAHNLYSFKDMQELDKNTCRIFIGANGPTELYHQVQDWRYPQQYKIGTDKLRYDYALIKLKAPVSEDSFLQVSLPNKKTLKKDKNQEITLFGYPGNHSNNFMMSNQFGKHIFLHQFGLSLKNCISEIDPQKCTIKYTLSTQPGQSGAPVVVDNKIIAIHAGSGQKGQQYNVGRLVTSDLIDSIKQWKKELIQNGASLKKVTFQNPQESTYSTEQIEQLCKKAQLLNKRYKYDLALQIFIKCLKSYEKSQGKESIKIAKLLNHIGHINLQKGDYSKALDAYSKSVQIFQKIDGKTCSSTAKALVDKGNALLNQGKFGQARQCYYQALKILQIFHKEHSIQAASILNNLGIIYYQEKDHFTSLQAYKASLQIAQKHYHGKENPDQAGTYMNIGHIYFDQKQYIQALRYYEKSVRMYEKIHGIGSIETASPLLNIGNVYDRQQNYLKAIDAFLKSIRIFEAKKVRNQDYAKVQWNIGNSYYYSKQFKQAQIALQKSLKFYEQKQMVERANKVALKLAKTFKEMNELEKVKTICNKYKISLN